MAQHLQDQPIDQRELVVAALGALMHSLPEDLPPEMAEFFGPRVLSDEQGQLPPILFYELVQQMSVAISITNSDAQILYVNKAFEHLTGYMSAEICGKQESWLSARQTPTTVYRDLWETIAAGGTWNGRLVNQRKDGGSYLSDLTIVPILTKTGKVSYFLEMQRDVTEMHLLQRQVENQKTLIESVIEGAPIALVLLDDDGAAILSNQAYKSLTGVMNGRDPAEFFLSHIAQALQKSRDEVLHLSSGFSNIEVPFECSGREPRWFSCSGRQVHELPVAADSCFGCQKQSALVLACNEITEQKRHFEKARTASVAARMGEQSIRHNVREVLAGALFQLQSPLNVIEAVTDMLARQPNDNCAVQEALGAAVRSGQEAVERLRAAMPHQNWAPVNVVNINEIIRDVLVINIDRMLAAGIIVEWRPQPRLPAVAGEASAIGLLLRYLLDNAADAAAESGAHARDVRILTRTTIDQMVEIVVHDLGPGIPKELRHKVFEPFFSGWKKAGPRAGLGLAIAQQIAGDHGGSLEIDDTIGVGCSMRLLLPACRAR